MATDKELKDINHPREEYEKLTNRLRLLGNRIMAIAMDYKFYIKGDFSAGDEIYELRDNVIYRLGSARFHFRILLEHRYTVENSLKELFKADPGEFFNRGFKFDGLCRESTREIYSLFDSMIYHLVSVFDYLCQVVNFATGKERMVNPKWNVLILDKNKKHHCFCSKELIPILEKLDADFVYPLIQHRSQLIHTKKDTGGFKMSTDVQGDAFVANFFATEQFKKYFPEIVVGNENCDFTIEYAALWLIDKTIRTSTEVLFELRDDLKKNAKPITGWVSGYMDENRMLVSPSTPEWGDRSVT